jgi:hypothetical protein
VAALTENKGKPGVDGDLAGGSSKTDPAMTEYTVKEVGHQRIVYADRRRIGTCADEDSASKLIAADGAANGATDESMIHETKASVVRRGEPTIRAVLGAPDGARCNRCGADQAVVPITDYENDRFIYACVFCRRWGLDPLRVDFPQPMRSHQKLWESAPVCPDPGDAE